MAGTTGTPMVANSNGSALAVQTPPVISQGAVAYGMASVPYGVLVRVRRELGRRAQGDTDPTSIWRPSLFATSKSWPPSKS